MFPKVLSAWLKDGWLGSDALTPTIIMEQVKAGRNSRLKDFVFQGPGWYPSHRVLVTPTGDTKNGEPTYELRFYHKDPRPELWALANMKTIFPPSSIKYHGMCLECKTVGELVGHTSMCVKHAR